MMWKGIFISVLLVLVVTQPTTQQGIPLPDLSCLNTQMIMGVVKCYIGGLTAMIFGGGSTSFGGHDDSSIAEESGLPFGVHNIIIKVTGFNPNPDHVSPIRQTPPTPGAEHLDLIYEHLEAAKSNLEWAADSFRDGLFSEAKTQEEVMKIIAFEKELLSQLDNVDPSVITEYFATSLARQVSEFQQTLTYITKVIQSHVTDDMVKEHQNMGGIDDLEDNIPGWILAIACAAEPRLCSALDLAQVAIDCLNTYQRDDFENGLKWVQCFYNCDAINFAVPCVNNAFDSCQGIAWIGDVLNKALIQYLDLEECMVLEMLPPDDTTLRDSINADLPPEVMPYDFVISEGDASGIPVKILNNMPPASFCFDFKDMLGSTAGLINGVGRVLGSFLLFGNICDVKFQVWTSNYMDALRGHNIVHEIPFTDDFVFGGPLCRDGFLLSQIKIGEHDFNIDGENQCNFHLNRNNWNGNITIPIRATADMKSDGDQDVFMTIKLVTGGIHSTTFRAKILVQDNDVDIPNGIHDSRAHSVCRSTSDPHMTTFDGSYYNNMYLGYFTLYNQKNLPYEVQIIYQTCEAGQSSEATCNCGVAVRSGDDVFVAERCRRDDGADQPLRSQLYLNGELTQGTFIFSEYEGQRFHIVLPHGETVRIVNDEHANVINVMVKPSAFDHGAGRTEGLCGQHTGSGEDDFLMPDGSIYLGEGTGEGEQPFGFIEAWRVEESGRMFEGVAASVEEFDVGTYCRCHFIPILGAQCRCDTSIVETCDMVVGDDVTATYISTALPGVPGQGLDRVTLDEGFVPGYMPSWDDSDIGENEARNSCEDYSNEHEMVKEFKRRVCPLIGSCKPNERVEFGCMDDILLTQDYQWMRTTREAVKDQVLDRETTPLQKTNRETREISDLMCLNDCHDQGVCVQARCECNDGWTGATCNVAAGSDVKITTNTQLCDKTTQECQYAIVTGFNFNADMKCNMKAFQATSDGAVYSGAESVSDLLFISSNQVACKIPDNENYTISVAGSSQAVHFIQYDSKTTKCDADNLKCQHIKTIHRRVHAKRSRH